MSLLANSNAIETGGYQISRSVRLRSSANAYLNRTQGTPTDEKKFTQSAWLKRGKLGVYQAVIGGRDNATGQTPLYFTSGDQIGWGESDGVSTYYSATTTAVFRDPAAWYHIVSVYDSNNATAADRLIIYVNGVRQAITISGSGSSIPSGRAGYWNQSGTSILIGATNTVTDYFDGYLTEINFIDGQALTPSSFGQTDTITGSWVAKKYTGTYGTNGFYLNFSDNSAATSTTIGKDYSGNGNNWTPNNISVTAGSTYDSMLDVPSGNGYADGGNGRGNYCTLNPLDFNSGTVSNGNLQWASSTAVGNGCFGTFAFDIADSTNKYYWEMTLTSGDVVFGIVPLTTLPSNTSRTGSYSYYTNGNKYSGTSASAYGSTFTSGDVIGVAVGNGIITFYKNNVSQGSAFTGLTGFFKPAIWEVSGTFNANFGQRPFSYTPPTGFKALNTTNLSDPTVKKGAGYFAATLYTGNGTSQSISNAVNGTSFQPDFVWIKNRSGAISHSLYDSVRGAGWRLASNETTAQLNYTSQMTAFNSNGFSVATTNNEVNESPTSYVGWQWKANGTGVSNTAGSITSTVSANTTSGFSIVTYTGTGSAATVGHGLGVAPAMVMVKSRSNNTGDGFSVYHKSLPSADYWLDLATTGAQSGPSSAVWNGTAPTSTVFSVKTASGTNTNTYTYVAYCFSAVAGYSRFGSYTGNGSTDGPFCYTGFQPKYILYKRSDSTGDWYVWDTARDTVNVVGNGLFPNYNVAEVAYGTILDIVSNGFKLRTNGIVGNASGATYIYAAFATSPFKFSNGR